MSELKPCPFCGEEVKPNTFPKYDPMSGCDRLARRVYCTNPECSNIFRDYSISKWNTRPIEDELRAEITRLKEENHALDQINRDIQTAAAHLDEVLAELARRDEELALTEKKLCNIDRSARAEVARRDEELKTTDGLLKEATETIGAVIACCTYNSNDDAKIGIYGIDQKAFTRIDQFITHYQDAVSAGKVSVDVKTSTDNNKRSKWKAYVPGWGAPTVNKRYLVKLINDWITIATYYLRVGGGYWKDDRGQELADGVVSLWKGLEE